MKWRNVEARVLVRQTDKGMGEREVIFAAIRKQLAKREQPFHLQRAKSDTYGRNV